MFTYLQTTHTYSFALVSPLDQVSPPGGLESVKAFFEPRSQLCDAIDSIPCFGPVCCTCRCGSVGPVFYPRLKVDQPPTLPATWTFFTC